MKMIYEVLPIGEGEYVHTLIEELIQCKDCKHWDETRYCCMVEFRTTPDWFCGDGERRTDED